MRRVYSARRGLNGLSHTMNLMPTSPRCFSLSQCVAGAVTMSRATALAAAACVAAALAGCNTPMPRDEAVSRAEYYLKYNRWQDAADTIKHTVESNPGDATAQAIYGDAMMNLGELDRAADAFDRALALDPTNMKLVADLAAVYFRQGNSEALYQRLRGAGANLHSVEAYLLLSQYAQDLNDPDTAISAAQAAIEIDDGVGAPRTAAPYARAAQLDALYGRPDAEVRRLRQAYALDPNNQQVCDRLRALGQILGPSLGLAPGV